MTYCDVPKRIPLRYFAWKSCRSAGVAIAQNLIFIGADEGMSYVERRCRAIML